MLIIMLIMTAFITPVRVCFVDDSDVDNWYEFDLFFDIFFYLDILMNFLSSFYDTDNKLIFEFKKIFIEYITGWFVIDLIAVFPFDSIGSSGGEAKLFRLLRLPRLYRLTKIVKLSSGGNDSFINKIFSRF